MKLKKSAKKSAAKTTANAGKRKGSSLAAVRRTAAKQPAAKRTAILSDAPSTRSSRTSAVQSAQSKPSSLASSGATRSAGKAAARTPRRAAATNGHASHGHPPLYYRLNTLLHMVRNVAHYEDHLCTILHELKTTGTADEALRHELAEVLEDMPSTDYTQELQAVRALLEGSRGTSR